MSRIWSYLSVALLVVVGACAALFATVEHFAAAAFDAVLAVPWAPRHLPPISALVDSTADGVGLARTRSFLERRRERIDQRQPMSFGVPALC